MSAKTNGGGDLNECSVCGSALTVDPTVAGGEPSCQRCGNRLWFSCETDGDPPVISFLGKHLRGEEVGRLARNWKPEGWAGLILDLRNVDFLDSAALGRLVNLKKTAGGHLVVRGLRPELVELFRVTRLDQLLTVEDESLGS